MKSIKLPMALWAAFSFTGCAGIPKPKTDLCIVNAPKELRKCYSMDTDYDDNGKLIAGAVPKYRVNATVNDLNKFLVIDSPTGTEDGQAALKAWLQKLRSRYANCKNPTP